MSHEGISLRRFQYFFRFSRYFRLQNMAKHVLWILHPRSHCHLSLIRSFAAVPGSVLANIIASNGLIPCRGMSSENTTCHQSLSSRLRRHRWHPDSTRYDPVRHGGSLGAIFLDPEKHIAILDPGVFCHLPVGIVIIPYTSAAFPAVLRKAAECRRQCEHCCHAKHCCFCHKRCHRPASILSLAVALAIRTNVSAARNIHIGCHGTAL